MTDDRLPAPHTPGQRAFEAWAQEQIGDSGYRDTDWYWENLTKSEQEGWERIAQAVADPDADGPKRLPAVFKPELREPASLVETRLAVESNRHAFQTACNVEMALGLELSPILEQLGRACLAGTLSDEDYATQAGPLHARLGEAQRETSARHGILRRSERNLEYQKKYWELVQAHAAEVRACLEQAAVLAKMGELPASVLLEDLDGFERAVRPLGEALFDAQNEGLSALQAYLLIPLTLNLTTPDSKE